MIAITRAVPPTIVRCELTHLGRTPIDPGRAEAQHARYEQALEQLGCTLIRCPPLSRMPDSVFVEDVAVVLPETAVITRPGAPSRRDETGSMREVLGPLRPLARIIAPGTLDGGDVLHAGSRVYVGLSERTNAEGIRQLQKLLSPHGYDVRVIPVFGCLHLKTAVTHVSDDTLLLNPRWVDGNLLRDWRRIEVHPEEPFGANALLVGGVVLFSATYPRTRERLEAQGIDVRAIQVDELEKAEAGVTCCSILVTS